MKKFPNLAYKNLFNRRFPRHRFVSELANMTLPETAVCFFQQESLFHRKKRPTLPHNMTIRTICYNYEK